MRIKRGVALLSQEAIATKRPPKHWQWAAFLTRLAFDWDRSLLVWTFQFGALFLSFRSAASICGEPLQLLRACRCQTRSSIPAPEQARTRYILGACRSPTA